MSRQTLNILLIVTFLYLLISNITVDANESCPTTTVTATVTATCTETPPPTLNCPQNNDQKHYDQRSYHNHRQKHKQNNKETVTCTLIETTCTMPTPTPPPCAPIGSKCTIQNFTSCCADNVGIVGCTFVPPNPVGTCF